MTTKLDKAGLAEIKKYEALRLAAYPDPGSSDGTPWTIGYGHTSGVKRGMVITRAQANKYLQKDVEWAERAVVKYVGTHLNQNQFNAMVSFAFNLGIRQFRSSSPVRYAKQRKHDLVPSRLNLWIKNDGKVMRGLVNRRAAEGALYSTPLGLMSAEIPSHAKVEPVTGKPMLKSKVGVTAIAQGGGAIAVVATQAADIKEQVTRLLDGLPFSTTPVLLGLVCVAGIGTAVWFFADRYMKSRKDGV